RYAYVAWTVLNLLLLYFSLRLLERWMMAVRKIWKPLPWALVAGYIPIGMALMQGQDSIELLLIACGTLALLQAGHPSAGGALFALGLFKFQIVVPVALLFLLWEQWRFCVAFFSIAGALAGLSVCLTGYGASRDYAHSLFSIGSNPQSASLLILPI